jgi:hypothetical protein
MNTGARSRMFKDAVSSMMQLPESTEPLTCAAVLDLYAAAVHPCAWPAAA